MPITYVPLIVSTISSQEAEEGKEIFCKSFMHSYNAQTATTQDMQQYASCVDTLYPERIDRGAVALIIVVTLALFAIGFIYRKKTRKSFDDNFTYAGVGLLWVILGWIVISAVLFFTS